jgi:hypothetical protein
MKSYNAAYHAENRDREIARNRAWKDKNRVAMNARRRADYVANIEHERAYFRERKKLRYWRNPQKYRELARLERAMPGAKEKQAARGKAWVARNRERVKASYAAWYAQNGDRAKRNAKAARLRDPERYRRNNRRNYFFNRARYAVTQKAWATRNPALVRATQKRWRLRNPGVARARASEARTLRLARRVAWANAAAIASFHREAELLTENTGRLHVVDHIIPLRGRTVSGLDVETNLRVVEASVNARKTNKWESPGWERPCASPGDVPLASGDAPPSQQSLF